MKRHATRFPGVRFREHKTRIYNGAPDKYFIIRYQNAGKRREEGLGWASQGWSAQKAAVELAALKKAHTLGTGPHSLKEKREAEAARRNEERIAGELANKENITFDNYFTSVYMPIAESYKTQQTINTETSMLTKRLSPVLGHLPLKDISAFHLEKLKKSMLDAGRAARSIQYTLAVFRQVWNHARRSGYVSGDSPTLFVKVAKVDNKRLRFLSHDEAAQLLETLESKSQQVHDMALLSLNTGMRAGELFSLSWGCVDMVRGQIQIVDTKSKRNRVAYMTLAVKAIFTRLYSKDHDPTALVLPDASGGRINSVSNTFDRAVKALGFNKGIKDPRQRFVFHSLRHTFASWLVENGTDLYTVKELLGHASITLTERYSHLGENTLKAAVKRLEGVI